MPLFRVKCKLCGLSMEPMELDEEGYIFQELRKLGKPFITGVCQPCAAKLKPPQDANGQNTP